MEKHEKLIIRACKALRSHDETIRRIKKIIRWQYARTEIPDNVLVIHVLSEVTQQYAPFESVTRFIDACENKYRDLHLYSDLMDKETDDSYQTVVIGTFIKQICYVKVKGNPMFDNFIPPLRFRNKT